MKPFPKDKDLRPGSTMAATVLRAESVREASANRIGRAMKRLTPARSVSRAAIYLRSFRIMYHACRVDYPCEGCEQPRAMSIRNADAWARWMAR